MRLTNLKMRLTNKMALTRIIINVTNKLSINKTNKIINQ